MDNLLQPVRENFPKLTIDKQKSPSYVEIYTNKDTEIVLAYIKVCIL